jgi:hypothetical protein
MALRAGTGRDGMEWYGDLVSLYGLDWTGLGLEGKTPSYVWISWVGLYDILLAGLSRV